MPVWLSVSVAERECGRVRVWLIESLPQLVSALSNQSLIDRLIESLTERFAEAIVSVVN